MQNRSATSSAYVDDISNSAMAGATKTRFMPNNPQETGAGTAAGDQEQQNSNSNTNQTDTDYGRQDYQIEDEFTAYNPLRDEDSMLTHGLKPRRQRRIGKGKRVNPLFEDYSEEDVWDFLGFLDELWRKLSDTVEEVIDEFENWNKWFKKEKKHPPAPDPARISYIREEFNTRRSPHMWKSNPDRKWVLTFGNNKVNNVVSSILYKYQNETISKDA